MMRIREDEKVTKGDLFDLAKKLGDEAEGMRYNLRSHEAEALAILMEAGALLCQYLSQDDEDYEI